VEATVAGEWTSFESEVAIDVDAAAEPAIVDNAALAADAGAAEVDTYELAQQQMKRAVRQAIFNVFG
jgi:hypothetical protein